jgi:hypothetical protein
MTNSQTAILFFLVFFFVAISPTGCKKDNQRSEISQIVQTWQGKEVLFPENIIFTIHGRDTVAYEIPASSYKIIVYVDSVGCTSCRLHLDKWQEIISDVDSLTNATVPILFFFHAKNLREISHFLERDKINTPVVFDLQDELNTPNQFPTHQQFQTCLLDEDNKVILIGNPVNNQTIREMYLSKISTGTYQAAVRTSQSTKIEVGETGFDLGTIPKQSINTLIHI